MSDQMKEISPGYILLMLFAIIGTPFLPLLISWQWDWWEAWVYAIVFILGFAISRLLAARRNPDLIAERAHYMHQADAKAWDKKLSPMVGLGSGFIPLVAGLDALFSWSSFVRYDSQACGADHYFGWICPGVICFDREPFFLGNGANPG
jgi:hypothetical protein